MLAQDRASGGRVLDPLLLAPIQADLSVIGVVHPALASLGPGPPALISTPLSYDRAPDQIVIRDPTSTARSSGMQNWSEMSLAERAIGMKM